MRSGRREAMRSWRREAMRSGRREAMRSGRREAERSERREAEDQRMDHRQIELSAHRVTAPPTLIRRRRHTSGRRNDVTRATPPLPPLRRPPRTDAVRQLLELVLREHEVGEVDESAELVGQTLQLVLRHVQLLQIAQLAQLLSHTHNTAQHTPTRPLYHAHVPTSKRQSLSSRQ